MSFAAVDCPHCGASLEVEFGAGALLCPQCAREFAIESDSVRLRREALTQLNAAWNAERSKYLVYETDSAGRGGQWTEPTMAGKIMGGVVILMAAATIFFWMPRQPGLEWLLYLIGGLMSAAGLYLLIAGPGQVKKFRLAKAAYEQKRQEIEQQFKP